MRNIERENEKVRELTAELEAKGYTVKVEPRADELPFSILDYQPDLIALKDQGGIIIEIKTSIKRVPISKFQEISKHVSQYKGWKFALVTLDDPLSSNLDTVDISLPDIEIIKERFNKLNTLIEMDILSAAILEAWSLTEGCLRILAAQVHIPVTLLQPSRLINHLYSEGELSIQQTDRLKELMKYRNMVAHGIDTHITLEKTESFKEALSDLITLIDSTS